MIFSFFSIFLFDIKIAQDDLRESWKELNTIWTLTEPSQIIFHSFLALGMGGWQRTMDQQSQ